MADTFVKVPSIYPKLLEIRQSKTAEFKSNKYLKETTKLRYYQVIGALHMLLLNRMVLADGTGLGKCVSENTYIPTSMGLMQIKDIIKKFLWKYNLKPGNLYPLPDYFKIMTVKGLKNPAALYFNGKSNGLKLTTNKGFTLEGLFHHPILCRTKNGNEFKKLSELKVGDYVCINRNGIFSEYTWWTINKDKFILETPIHSKTYSCPGYITEKLAELLGYFISEGNSSTSQTFVITQFDIEINNRIRYLLKECFNYSESVKNKSIKESIIVNSANIIRFLHILEINVQALSAEKIIPLPILMSSKKIVRAYLRGYFEGDGCVEKRSGGISCSSKSEKMIRQIQLVLLNFGIIAKIKKKMVKIKDTRRPYWILYFFGQDVDIFHQEIGFVSSRKTGELNNIVGKIRNTNNDIIPFSNQIIGKAIKDITKYLKTLPEHHGSTTKGSGWKGVVGLKNKRIFESVIFNKRHLTYRTLNLLINIIDTNKFIKQTSNYLELKNLSEENLFFDRINMIEKVSNNFIDFHVPDLHCFTGNGFINHNTIQSLTAYTWNKDRDQSLKLVVVTVKSALVQWLEELEKFTQGITARVLSSSYECLGLSGKEARLMHYRNFKEDILIINYEILRQEYELIKECLGKNYMVIFDEATAFKNRKSLNFFACQQLAQSAQRVYGLSATVLKNNLEEVFSIYSVIVPGLFGNITSFCKTFCEQKLMKLKINGKTRYIPQTIGYKNLHQFKQLIDPYILARKKEEVASELPKLMSRKVIVEMEPEQKELYKKALSGILYEERVKHDFYEVSDKIRNGATDEKTVTLYNERKEKYEKFLTEEGKKRGKLAALTYCQMVSNGPALLREPGESSKDNEFERLITEELVTEKIIVFTRFKSGIPNLEIICEHHNIKFTKITGDVLTAQERDKARHAFQDDPSCRIIFITTAGSASLNLQAAGVVIFIDTPWSYGDLVQTIGRAQRIGSLQEHILLIHLLNKGSIDMRVMDRVSKKKDLSDEILGDTAVGALDFTEHDDNSVDDLFNDLLGDAEKNEL